MEEVTYYVAETEKGYLDNLFFDMYVNFNNAQRVYNTAERAKEVFDRKAKGVPYKLLKVVERSERIITEVNDISQEDTQ